MKELNEAYTAWHQCKKNATKAAKLLKISRSTFRERLERAEIFYNSKVLGPKILLIDIETSKTISGHYGMHNIHINKGDVLQTWFMLSVSWKWLDEDTVHAVSLLDDKKALKTASLDIRNLHVDDSVVVKKCIELLSEADVVVFQNGLRFDLMKIKAGGLRLDLPAVNKHVYVDTFKIAKKHLSVESLSLDFLCRYFGIETKQSHSRDMFIRAQMLDVEALKELVSYNKQDVIALEGLYYKLRPYIETLNFNLWSGTIVCKNCGSPDLKESPEKLRTRLSVFTQFRCGCCGTLTAARKSVVKPQGK